MAHEAGKGANMARTYTDAEIQEIRRSFVDAFEYKDGMLFWKIKVSDKVNIGSRAGSSIGKANRRRIRINNIVWQEHRVIFLMFYGFLPDEVDHIDCNSLNNKIENLRPAIRVQNTWNQKLSKKNTSGFKNVCWKKDKKKWRVEVRSNNKIYFLGYFDDIKEANLTAIAARKEMHGDFANHG